MEQVLSQLKPIMESPSISKVAHNCTFDLTVLEGYGIRSQGMDFDTMVASQLSGKKTIGLKELVLDVLGVEMTKISDLIGTGSKQISFDRLPIDERVRDYACADADLPLRLVPVFEEAMQTDGVRDLFNELEMPLVPAIVDMQRNGVALEEGMLHEMARDINEQLHQLETQVYNDAGRPFNINSPQQLSQLLFEELKLGPTKRTRTGAYTTDAQALEALKGHHPGHRWHPRIPPAFEAQGHVRRRPSRTHKSAYQAHTYQFQPSGLGHGPHVQQRSQPPEHTHPDRVGATGAAGVHRAQSRRRAVAPVVCRLLSD